VPTGGQGRQAERRNFRINAEQTRQRLNGEGLARNEKQTVQGLAAPVCGAVLLRRATVRLRRFKKRGRSRRRRFGRERERRR
jgi:hypothetical protein